MRVVFQTLLVIFFVIFFAATLITASVKFELLNYTFWTKSFTTHNVYQKLAQVVKSSLDSQVSKSGGNKDDIAVLTDLITPTNTADFVNKNLLNFLNFTNGYARELKVYIPLDKVPSGLLPKTLTGINQEMTLDQLSTRFNITGLSNLPIGELNKVGLYDYYTLMVSVSLLVISLILLVLSVGSGGRFIAPGMAFILSGFVAIAFTGAGNNANSYMAQNLTTGASINNVILFTVFPSIIKDLSTIWMYVGVGAILIGILFFFVKKREAKTKIPLND